MSITLYFGLPRSGKTTFAAAIAVETQKKIDSGKSKYKSVYTNFHVNYPGIRKIDPAVHLGNFEITDSLILIDEATLILDCRDYKNFDKTLRKFFFLHGHFRLTIITFAQQFDSLDKGIRVCTDKVFYVHKGRFRRWISYAMPIPYGIIIPDPKKSDGDKLGEIIQGYCKPNLLLRILQPRIRRRKYYKYFDSWEHEKLPDLPVRTWVNPQQSSAQTPSRSPIQKLRDQIKRIFKH